MQASGRHVFSAVLMSTGKQQKRLKSYSFADGLTEDPW